MHVLMKALRIHRTDSKSKRKKGRKKKSRLATLLQVLNIKGNTSTFPTYHYSSCISKLGLHQKIAEYMLAQNGGLPDFHFATNQLFGLK